MMDFQDFVLIRQGNTCVGALAGVDMPDDTGTELVFILSSLFMKNVVTIFDLGTPAVGFGKLKATKEQFGEYTIVLNVERTALGTGPTALLDPTIVRPTPTSNIDLIFALLIIGAVAIALYTVVATPGTGPLNENTSGINKQAGLPNPGTIAVVSNLEATTVPATEPNTLPLSSISNSNPLTVGTFVEGSPAVPSVIVTTGGAGAAPGKTSSASSNELKSSRRKFACLRAVGIAVVFFML